MTPEWEVISLRIHRDDAVRLRSAYDAHRRCRDNPESHAAIAAAGFDGSFEEWLADVITGYLDDRDAMLTADGIAENVALLDRIQGAVATLKRERTVEGKRKRSTPTRKTKTKRRRS